MKTLLGPGLHLAQFVSDAAPFNSLDSISAWAASLGFTSLQIPSWDRRLIDIEKAAQSQDYCDTLLATVKKRNLQISELTTHLQGQLIAVHPAYDSLFDPFAPPAVHDNPKARTEWARNQLLATAKASRRLHLTEVGTFSGALAWPYLYPWPQRPPDLIHEAFAELARRWTPILNAFADEGVNLCFEIHPGEDLHDGVTFERFLALVHNHPRCQLLYDPSHFVLQQLDYLEYIDIYQERIRMFHVKDAEFRPSGRQGVYGGYQDWVNRAGRFRSVGDGQVDFKSIFSKLAQHDFAGWAVLEWECCLKDPEVGAREGAKFIRENIIPVTSKTFDDFAAPDSSSKSSSLRSLLGLS